MPAGKREGVGCSPDFMNYRPDTQINAQFDKKLLLDFVKHHKNVKQEEETELRAQHRGLPSEKLNNTV